jgi:para-nitrobenzyl esterase
MKSKNGRSKLKLGKVMVFLGVSAMLLLIALSFSSVSVAEPYKFKKLVETQYGKIQGFKDINNTLVWKSIPYAKPPVGDLRWRAPEDPESWNGTRVVTQDCEPCTQMDESTMQVIGKEDCLYLNIWRPNNDNQNLPVYVWIHGGSNITGSISIPLYNGAILAGRSDVVVVSIQYRLGPLGWLTHPALETGNPTEDSGNYGTLDHIKALKWIKENIAAFGGNPDNVLITGESAGGHNVMNLVISPLAAGLFHGAMSESGGLAPVFKLDSFNNRTVKLLDKLLLSDGLSSIPDGDNDGDIDKDDARIYLRSKTSEELIKAFWSAGASAASAHQDGVVIPGGYLQTINSGIYNKVPIILGSNKDEMKFFQPGYGVLAKSLGTPSSPYTWSDLFNVAGVLGPPTLSLTEVLPTAGDQAVYEAIGSFGSLNWRFNFVDRIARALAGQQNQVVYAYHFKWDGVDPYKFIFGAAHAVEIPFFFGLPLDIYGGVAFSPTSDTPGRRALSDAMMNYLANFAYLGDPNGGGLPVWQSWSNNAGEPKAIVFEANDDTPEIVMTTEEIKTADVAARYWATSTITGIPLLNQFVWVRWWLPI